MITIKELSQDEELRLLAEAREKNLKDEVSRLSAAKREGIQESAKALILAGSDVNFVKETLKLSDEEMKKINEEMSKVK